MARSVLIVDKDAARRSAIAAACVERGAEVREADDPFSAMAALGQQSFDVLCAYAGPRHLSLRGLFQLAKRKRDDILIWAFVEPEDHAAVELSFAEEARIIDLTLGTAAIATAFLDESEGSGAPAAAAEATASPMLDTSASVAADAVTAELDLPPAAGLDLDLADDYDEEQLPPPVPAAPSPPAAAPRALAPAPAASVDDGDREDEALEDGIDVDIDVDVTPPAPFDIGLDVTEDLVLPAAQLAPRDDDAFDMDFRTPPPGGAWDAGSGDESDIVELDALMSASGEGESLPSGAETFIAVFARELTGRLVIQDGERRWCLCLYVGEPAWLAPPGGDAAVFERLVARSLLPPDASPASVPEGELLGSLVERGEISRDDAQGFMRQLVFDSAIEVASLESCSITVEEAPHFLSTPPPFRVNPFGVVLESRRRRTRPDDLLTASREIQDAPLVASRSLDKVYGKVAPFLRGIDVRSILEHGSTLRGFQEAAGVDSMLATELVLALEAVGLVRIDRAAAGA